MNQKIAVGALVGAAVFGGACLFVQCGGDGWTDSHEMRFSLVTLSLLGAAFGAAFGAMLASEIPD